MANEEILMVEDEENILEAVKYSLEKDGYSVITATDGQTGLHLAKTRNPDLIILDIMLPKMDGLDVCKSIRMESNIPIIMLTAKGEEIDKIIGLELGADDYITKPFSIRELIARVKALLRRASTNTNNENSDSGSQTFTTGKIHIDIRSHTATIDGMPLDLRPKEFDLLSFFVANVGMALTRDHILEKIWGYDYIGKSRTVDVHVRWLREKIETDPSNPKTIITLRGTGYRLI
jgi:two-component system alkaline phosphatase synthesis response regulator PhoP